MLKTLKFILPLAFLGMISCIEEPISIDSNLSDHVNEFYRQANMRGISPKTWGYDIVLTSGLLKNKKCYGITTFNGTKNTLIELDYDFVMSKTSSTNDSLMIQIVMFHELGHALLYKHHTPKSDRISIMYPGPLFEMYFDKKYREQCLDKLFSK